MTMVPIGVRIPAYLDEFLKSHENRDLNISKSTIIRKLLEYGYQNPEIIVMEYASSDQISLLRNQVSELNKQLETMEKRQTEFLQLLESLNSITQVNRTILEKALGKSLGDLVKAPDYIIEQLYADFKETKRE